MTKLNNNRVPPHDLAIRYINDHVEIHARRGDEFIQITASADAAEIRAAVDSLSPGSRSAILVLGHPDLTLKSNAAPPGLGTSTRTFARSILATTVPMETGCWVFGDREKSMLLAFGTPSELLNQRIAQIRAAKLILSGCIPEFALGAGAALNEIRDSGFTYEKNGKARNVLVVDTLVPESVTLCALSGDRTLVVRPLSREAVPGREGVLEEARRTISYIRERFRGLALNELYFCGDDPELVAELEREGLRSIASSPRTIGDAALRPLPDFTDRVHASFINLLPDKERSRPARHAAMITLGMLACVAIFSIAQTTAEVRRLERSFETSGADPGAATSRPESIMSELASLRQLREQVKSLQLTAARLHGPRRAPCLDHLTAVLQRMGNNLQIESIDSDGISFAIKGYLLEPRGQAQSSLEKFAIDAASAMNAQFPSITITPVLPEEEHILETVPELANWSTGKFLLQFKWNQ